MKTFLIAALAILLASCTNPNTGENYTTAEAVAKVQELCIQICSYEPEASATAAMLTASNPAVVGVSAVAHAICSVVQSHNMAAIFGMSAQAQEADTNCPDSEKVNGVCVRGKKKEGG